jgi:CheY-like chemotaxis protein
MAPAVVDLSGTPDAVGDEVEAAPDDLVSHAVAYGVSDGSTILVVDDDFRDTFAFNALLDRGHRVIISVSGAEALAALEETPDVDVVLMDIRMPVMDGYETMRAIRAIDRFRSLPIIAVTGKTMASERQRCIDAGANDYVPKPVDSAELFAALRPWLPTTARPNAA